MRKRQRKECIRHPALHIATIRCSHIDLPGFKKEDININYENGYLTISTSKGLDKDEKDEQGHYIRQER